MVRTVCHSQADPVWLGGPCNYEVGVVFQANRSPTGASNTNVCHQIERFSPQPQGKLNDTLRLSVKNIVAVGRLSFL